MVGGRDRAAALERRAHGGRLADLAQVAVVGALVRRAGRRGRRASRRATGRNASESAAASTPATIQRRRCAPGGQQQPAEHGEAVEEREQDGRRAHVAADQRQPEQRADRGTRPSSRPTTTSGSAACAQALAPGEHEPDRDPDHERLAQRVAEVLQRPVRRRPRTSRRRSTASARSAVPCSECSGSPVTSRSISAHSSGASTASAAAAARAGRRAAARARARRARPAPTPRAHQPGHGEQAEHGRAAAWPLRLQQHGADDHAANAVSW